MTATFRAMGAAGGVTGSAYHLTLGTAQLLVDCGVFQGEREAAERNRQAPVERPDELDAVVLTHGHLDHVGRLPLLLQGGFRGRIHGHPATLAITELVLRDSAKIAHHEGSGVYDERDVEDTVARFSPIAYETRTGIATGVHVTLFDAGHILGSSSALLETSEGTILFSGDLGRRGTPILRDPNTRYPAGLAIDWVVIESTYGDRDHPPARNQQAELHAALRRSLSDGGKVLIPAFSIGRTQELLYHLHAIYRDGHFAGIPVVVDGPMGLDVTDIYERFRDAYDAEAMAMVRHGEAPLEFRDLYGSRSGKGTARMLDMPGPAIVIAGSGMCSGGRILAYLEKFLPDARTDVLFVGYQGRGTLGRRLLEGAREVVIDGAPVQVRAQAQVLHGFSAHAGKGELLDWWHAVPGKGRGTLVTHGEVEQADKLAAVCNATRAEFGAHVSLW